MISIYIQMSHKLLLNMRASWCSFSFNWLLYSWCRQKIARLSTLENCHTYALINKKSWMSLSLLQQLTTKVAVLSTDSNKLNSKVFWRIFREIFHCISNIMFIQLWHNLYDLYYLNLSAASKAVEWRLYWCSLWGTIIPMLNKQPYLILS